MLWGFPTSVCANDSAYIIGYRTPQGFEQSIPFVDDRGVFVLSGSLLYLWCPANGLALNAYYPDGFNFALSIYHLSARACLDLIVGEAEPGYWAPARQALP